MINSNNCSVIASLKSSGIGISRFLAVKFATWSLLVPVMMLVTSSLAHAVAGGAGGGDSGGGGDGGGAEIIFNILLWIILELPFPFNIIGIAIVVLCVWLASKRVRSISGLNKIPSTTHTSPLSFEISPAFMSRNPSFTPDSLLAKANTAFLAVQQAWSKQDMAPVRRWISDGVWQRFTTQITMMRLLEQQNTVDNIQIRTVFVDAIEEDGDFDIVHLGIHFTAEDNFVSAKYPQLDRRGSLEMFEYWTFVRKAGVAEKDMYHSNRCPACGAELPADMGEVARCPNCQVVSTLGDYDWVLAEITQADDYVNQNRKLKKSGSLTQKIRNALGADRSFSVQSIEDKAANAYMQIMAAQVTKKPELMRRFVGDQQFERLSQEYAQQSSFVFNRLYLNSVTAIDFYRADGKDNLVIAIKRTAQRVAITADQLVLVDQGMYTRNEILLMSRDVGAGQAKASLYAHSCPACGAPVGDTLDLKCAYCGELLNSTHREWIVTRLLASDEYKTLTDNQQEAMTTGVAVNQLDPLYGVRDYAFNNVLMIVGIDGEITPEELQFGRALSRKLGYNEQKISGMFELAKNRQLTLRLPEDRKSAIKVRMQMEKAALADSRISPEEQSLLNEVGAQIERMRM